MAVMDAGAVSSHDGAKTLIASPTAVAGISVYAAVMQIARTLFRPPSSTAQDLARVKPTEIDDINGYGHRRGLAWVIFTPANRALWRLVKLRESRKLQTR